ncbi:MAG: hypothetical protein FGM33_06655 [Candidatus Kapabacteria bacterium]|nr:hypothetical protein [Candidatus Kapabacteria bacterium]
MRLLTTLGLASLAIVLASCSSDEPTSPSGSYPAYVHTVNGSYMTYSNITVAIDTATKQTTNTPAADDSSVVVSSQTGEQVDPATSTKQPFYSTNSHVFVNNEPTDTVTLSQLGGKITQSFRLSYNIQSFALNIGRKNVVINDLANSTWTALKDTVLPFDFPGMPQYKVSGTLNFTGKSLGDETVTLNGQSIKTKKSQIDLNATLFLAAGPTQLPLPIKLVRTYWFAEKLGVVKMEQKAEVINLGIIGGFLGTPVQAVPGLIQTAKSWSTR